MWKHSAKFVAIALAGLALAACATGKSVSETPQAEIALALGKARIAVYRTQVVGFAVQPVVKLNDRKTGSCVPNGVFYIDVPPGKYEVSATTEVTDSVTVTARANRTAYVECSIDFGILVGRPHLVEVTRGTAQPKVGGLVYKGKF